MANWVDFAVIVIIGVSVIIGLFRGLVKESISLATWILAIWVALVFGPRLSGLLPFTVGSATIQNIIASAVLFILVIILGGVVNYLLSQIVDKTGLSGTDRSLGLVFGALRGAAIVAILVLLATLTNLPNEPWWQQSKTLPFFYDIALWLKDLLPPSLADHFT